MAVMGCAALILAALTGAWLLGGPGTHAQQLPTATPTYTAVATGPWDAPSTWDQGASVPPGAHVTIPAGLVVTWGPDTAAVVDVLLVQGRLQCDASAAAANIAVHVVTLLVVGPQAWLTCGTRETPFLGRLTITLTGTGTVADDSRRSIVAREGGTISLHGAPKRSWTRLLPGQHAQQGATTLLVEGPVQGWQVGDAVVIGPTDYVAEQAEMRRVNSVTGDPAGDARVTLGLDAPLEASHNGETYSVVHKGNGKTYTLDARAEVAVLTRSILIEGGEEGLVDGLGGDLRAWGGESALQLSNVEITRMGKLGQLGRYPFHLHNLGGAGARSYAVSVAVHHTFQRCMVVHCTDNALLRDNVCFDTPGFAFMLEDGAESNNTLQGNLGMLTRAGRTDFVPTERDLPGTFWFQNPSNHFLGNVAAGGAGPAFMLDLGGEFYARFPTLFTCNDRIPGYLPTRNPGAVVAALLALPLGRFRGNRAHATTTGLWVSAEGGDAMRATFASAAEPVNVVEDTQMYKIRVTNKFEFEGCSHFAFVFNWRLQDTICANTRMAFWHNEGNTLVRDALVLNAPIINGTPDASTRALQAPGMTGLSWYRAPQSADRVHFAGWPPMPATDQVYSRPDQQGRLFATNVAAAQSVGVGDGNGHRNTLGLITSDAPEGGLRVELFPGFAGGAVDAAGSVSGRPGSLLLPIRRCTDPAANAMAPVISPWRADAAACPRELDPIVARLVAEDPSIDCAYLPSHVLFSCTGPLRLVGLLATIEAPSLPQTPEALAIDIRSAAGAPLRPLLRLFPELATSGAVALGANRLYRLSSAALSAATALQLDPGAFEGADDYMRLVLEGVRAPRVSAGNAYAFSLLVQSGVAREAASPAEVDSCAPPARVCWCYEERAGAWHVRFGAGSVLSPVVALDGSSAGLLAPPTDLLLTWTT